MEMHPRVTLYIQTLSGGAYEYANDWLYWWMNGGREPVWHNFTLDDAKAREIRMTLRRLVPGPREAR